MTRLRLLLVTGTRADFGLWLPVLAEASRRSERLDARLLVTAMHLDARFGETVREIRQAGVPIVAEVACTPDGDSRADMAAALGVATSGIAHVLADERPDWLLLLGDRGEQAAAALVALHLDLPVAHLHGGEVTRGAVDDALRDVISRIAHLHLPATGDAELRLRAMGEEAWRIRVVGAPGLDQLAEKAAGDLDTLRHRHGLGAGAYLLVAQHPETVGDRDPVTDLAATLDAVGRAGLPALAILSNADAGGRAMVDLLTAAADAGRIKVVDSLPRDDYVTLLAGAAALVGNSSSGIIEAPFLGVPAVNVGGRQEGRTRGDNELDAAPEADAIERAIRAAMDPAFRSRLSRRSPYGDGRAAPRILDALEKTPRDRRLLEKHVGEGRAGRPVE
jgi:GDP/UDP-N,N'-diacetylbacillosamine 2-epimerase (hydrolysing)